MLQGQRMKRAEKVTRKIKKLIKKVQDPRQALTILIEMELNGIIKNSEKSRAVSKTTMTL